MKTLINRKAKAIKVGYEFKRRVYSESKMFIEAKIKDFQNAKGSVVIFDRD